MGKINLCIAASLDGYIADRNGSVDFLFEKPRVEPDPTYQQFYKEVDVILFGYHTYRQMVDSISPDKWMYPGKKCYVFSNNETGQTADVTFTNASPREFAQNVVQKTSGTVWLFGGRKLIHSFMQEDLIDEYLIYHMPVILGGGVPLFTQDDVKRPLVFTGVSHTDGMVKSSYKSVR